MKKTMMLLIVFSITGIYGCKGDGDILATYKNEKITRGDFYTWLESRKIKKESIINSKTRQKDRLEKMALELITVQKAKEEGFDKKPDFQPAKNRISEGILMKTLYNREIRDKAAFKEPAAKVRQILLRVKNFDADPQQKNKRIKLSEEQLAQRYNETIARAKDIIQKLDKGESFEELAKQYSEDSSKKKGGDIGFVVPNMLPQDLSDVVFTLKEGEYTREPVKIPGGVYIVKVEETDEVTEKNIDDIIENKSQASRVKNGMMRSVAREFVDNLMKADDVKLYEEKVLSKNEKDIIFTIGNNNYTVADLNKKLESGTPRSKNGKTNRKIKDTDKLRMAKSFYQLEVLKREALNKGIDKDPEYIEEVQSRIDPMLASEYAKSVLEKDITVSDREMLDEYSKNKDKRYFQMIKKGKERVKKIKPFKEVKEGIERSIVNRKKSEMKKNWESRILAQYEFKINESELEGEKK
ncbi:MAG: peptidylprolyl isomerase [Spirochaetes bacterium]|nr:peptidylprolyl isomerase [Spirochaetota bacterium]